MSADDDAPIHFRGFAQGTPSSSFTPRSAVPNKLRHQGISFVSAGVNSPIIEPRQQPHHSDADIALDDTDDEEDDDLEDDDVEDSHIQTNIVLEADIETSEEGMKRMQIDTSADTMEFNSEGANASLQDNNNTMSEEQLFVIDTVGDASLEGNVHTSKQPMQRAPSPARSDSSEEVVVFSGRKTGTTITDPVQSQKPLQSAATGRTGSSGNTSATQAPSAHNPVQPAPSQGWGGHASKHDSTQRPGSGWTPAPEVPYWKKGKGMPRPDLAPAADEKQAFEAALPRQTKVQFAEPSNQELENRATGESIETLQANWKKALSEKQAAKKKAEMDDDPSPKTSKASRRSKRGRKKGNRELRNTNISDDDDDSEAAYDDYMENLMAQLEDEEEHDDEDAIFAKLKASHSGAISGPSMVVDGNEIGDDEVLPKHMKLNAHEMQEGEYEMNEDSEWSTDDSELDMDNMDIDALSSAGSTELEQELEYTEREQWEDEEDLRQRRIERYDDEHIARLLAKQEELGLGSQEILIEDGDYPYASDEFGDLEAARAELDDLTNSHFGSRANKYGLSRGSKRNPHFPSATAMADAVDQYGENGFDIMDFERPSLRPTKRGRKGQPPPELEMLSDEDLKENLAEQWQKDKATKRQKKLEREELRAEGMLGSAGRKGKADLIQKYSNGMSIHQVWDELRVFLQDDDMRMRAFPPMDKVDRKSLHQVAQAVGLKSKSQGGGAKRFPILYKTSQTEDYSPDMFHQVIQASARGSLGYGRMKKGKKGKGTPARGGKAGGFGGRGGGGVGAATVRHGEVVGAGAAEISEKSFGHKMMMKMGWSKGKALGKDGEGLLTPIEQRMRVGTAGLG